MTDEIVKNEEKNFPNILDLGFLFGFFKVKTTHRNNRHSTVITYFIISFAANLYLTQFVSHWFAITLFLTTVIPFCIVFFISMKDKNFFDSEEHIEIINNQQLAFQGNKDAGAVEVHDEQPLYFPENVNEIPSKKLVPTLVPRSRGRKEGK